MGEQGGDADEASRLGAVRSGLALNWLPASRKLRCIWSQTCSTQKATAVGDLLLRSNLDASYGMLDAVCTERIRTPLII